MVHITDTRTQKVVCYTSSHITETVFAHDQHWEGQSTLSLPQLYRHSQEHRKWITTLWVLYYILQAKVLKLMWNFFKVVKGWRNFYYTQLWYQKFLYEGSCLWSSNSLNTSKRSEFNKFQESVVLGGNCPRWQLSWVAVVLGGTCPGWQLSYVAVVLSGSCSGWQLS